MIEDDIEYLKNEIAGLEERIAAIENKAILEYDVLIIIIAGLEERFQDIEELITFQDVANIMTKEYKDRLFRNRTGGDIKGFTNLHIRDEVKFGEVLKKSIEEIKNMEE